jgi:hypothetical protein
MDSSRGRGCLCPGGTADVSQGLQSLGGAVKSDRVPSGRLKRRTTRPRGVTAPRHPRFGTPSRGAPLQASRRDAGPGERVPWTKVPG